MPDRARQLLFGIKSAAVKEAERSRRIAADAQWRAEYDSKQVRQLQGAQAEVPLRASFVNALLCEERQRQRQEPEPQAVAERKAQESAAKGTCMSSKFAER